MFRSIALLLSLVLLSSSCATLFAEDRREVMVTSSPPGAHIMVNGMHRGFTPTRILVNNHEQLQVSITKPGFHPAGCYIDTSVGAIWVILDIVLISALLPLVIDLVTNEWSSLDHGFCSVTMAPSQ